MLFLRIDALGILSTNKFKYHVSCLLSANYVRTSPHLKLHQERITTCNQKTLFKKLFKGYSRCPTLLKNQSGQLPEPPNSPRSWKETYKIQALALSHSFSPGPLTVLGREICRKEPVMKMMVEHHFAGSPKEIEGIIYIYYVRLLLFFSLFVRPFEVLI